MDRQAILSKFISTQGYKKDSPDKNRPMNVIPSNQITMSDVEFPVIGVDNLGNKIVMQPGRDYTFPGNYVVETPIKNFDNTESIFQKHFNFTTEKKQNGGLVNFPFDYQQFLEYNKTAPSNRQISPNYKYGNPRDYDHYGMWEALGKPKDFTEAKQKNPDWLPNDEDGLYHGFSVNPNTGIYLKSHVAGEYEPNSTTWMEYMAGQLSNKDWGTKYNQTYYDPEIQRLRTRPKMENGGWLDSYQKGGVIFVDDANDPRYQEYLILKKYNDLAEFQNKFTDIWVNTIKENMTSPYHIYHNEKNKHTVYGSRNQYEKLYTNGYKDYETEVLDPTYIHKELEKINPDKYKYNNMTRDEQWFFNFVDDFDEKKFFSKPSSGHNIMTAGRYYYNTYPIQEVKIKEKPKQVANKIDYNEPRGTEIVNGKEVQMYGYPNQEKGIGYERSISSTPPKEEKPVEPNKPVLEENKYFPYDRYSHAIKDTKKGGNLNHQDIEYFKVYDVDGNRVDMLPMEYGYYMDKVRETWKKQEKTVPKLQKGGVIDDPLKMSAFAQKWGYSPKKETIVDKNYFQNLKEFGIPDEPTIVRDNVVQVKPTPPHKETIPYDPLYKFNPKNWGVPDYTHFGGFDKAYIEARKAGEKEFMWNRNRFNTRKDTDEIKVTVPKDPYLNPNMYSGKTYSDYIKTNYPELFKVINRGEGLSNIIFEGDRDAPRRGFYNRMNNTISVGEKTDMTDDMFIGTLIAEMAHQKDPDKNKVIGSWDKDNFYDRVRYGEDRYNIEGTVEYNTHRLYEPGLAMIAYGDLSPNDIKRIQKYLGIEEDGYFGENTYKALVNKYKDSEYIKFVMSEHQLRTQDKDKYPISMGLYPGLAKAYLHEINQDVPLRNSKRFQNPVGYSNYTDEALLNIIPGSGDYDVISLQRILSNKGYKLPKSTKKDGSFDGVWGEETETALNDYRKKINSKYQNGGEANWLNKYE